MYIGTYLNQICISSEDNQMKDIQVLVQTVVSSFYKMLNFRVYS